MLVKSHILLLKINLSERVSKDSHVVSIPLHVRVRYWGSYTIYIYNINNIYIYITYICIWYNILYITYTVQKRENALITLSAMEIHY